MTDVGSGNARVSKKFPRTAIFQGVALPNREEVLLVKRVYVRGKYHFTLAATGRLPNDTPLRIAFQQIPALTLP